MAAADPPRRRGEAGRSAYLLVAALVVVALIAGGAVLLWPSDGGSPVFRTPSTSAGTEPTQPSAAGLTFEPIPTAGPVLEPSSTTPVSAAKVRAALRVVVGDPSLGRHLGLVVAALDGRRPLWSSGDSGSPDPVTPASTLKLLTCLTALETLGPDHRFTTSVVAGPSPRRIVLVGGGDPLLTDVVPAATEPADSYPVPATLADLAVRTARALKARGRTDVSLTYDATLFSGPAVSPAWEPGYVPESVVSPISALWVDEGRSTAGLAARVADPALEAARRFAAALVSHGVTVRRQITAAPAAGSARVIAAVSSAPLDEIVQHVLELSDNEGAEVLLRQAAIASGRAGSFAGGVATVRQVLHGLHVDLTGARLYDGSGLSRSDAIPVEALVDVLQVAADPEHSQLRSVVSGLPVAGFTGSLDYRFVDSAPAGLGLVRAKTGTLTGVHALAGVVSTAGGQPLLFAAVADRVPVPMTLAARRQLELIATALATCVCTR